VVPGACGLVFAVCALQRGVPLHFAFMFGCNLASVVSRTVLLFVLIWHEFVAPQPPRLRVVGGSVVRV